MRQIAVLTAFLTCSSAFGADPLLMKMVMPDVRALAGADIGALRASPFGIFVVSKFAAINGAQKLLGTPRVNFLQGISEVLIATAGDDPSHPDGLFLLRGKFNVDQMIAELNKRRTAQVETYLGSTLVTDTNPGNHGIQAVAFIGDSIVVAGSVAIVEAALSRNGSPSNSIDPALAAQVDQLSASEDEWTVNSIPVAALVPGDAATPASPAAQALPLLRGIQSFAGGVKFTDNVQFTGQVVVGDALKAAAFSGAVQLAAGLGSKAAAANAGMAQMAPVLQSLQVSTDGSTVHLSLSIPEELFESSLIQLFGSTGPVLPNPLRQP